LRVEHEEVHRRGAEDAEGALRKTGFQISNLKLKSGISKAASSRHKPQRPLRELCACGGESDSL
jgi:hypothetical protein